MQCPAASFWLKRALAETANRDPVDSLNDAEVLLEILKAECETACGLASLEQPDADIQSRIYRGELEATDADGIETMGGLQ
jgi:hypothetical protein